MQRGGGARASFYAIHSSSCFGGGGPIKKVTLRYLLALVFLILFAVQEEASKWQTVPGLMPVMQREEVYM